MSRLSPAGDAEFAAWFGRSRVVDADGQPLVVYHGTSGAHDQLDPARTTDGGLHFGTAGQADMRPGPQGKRLFPAYLRIENPRRSRDSGGKWRKRIQQARAAGHDGIVYLNRYEGLTSEVIERLAMGGLLGKLDAMSDAQFRRAVPEARDSYIVFASDQVRCALARVSAVEPPVERRRRPAQA
jgi:hypothetical protein